MAANMGDKLQLTSGTHKGEPKRRDDMRIDSYGNDYKL